MSSSRLLCEWRYANLRCLKWCQYSLIQRGSVAKDRVISAKSFPKIVTFCLTSLLASVWNWFSSWCFQLLLLIFQQLLCRDISYYSLCKWWDLWSCQYFFGRQFHNYGTLAKWKWLPTVAVPISCRFSVLSTGYCLCLCVHIIIRTQNTSRPYGIYQEIWSIWKTSWAWANLTSQYFGVPQRSSQPKSVAGVQMAIQLEHLGASGPGLLCFCLSFLPYTADYCE